MQGHQLMLSNQIISLKDIRFSQNSFAQSTPQSTYKLNSVYNFATVQHLEHFRSLVLSQICQSLGQ